MTTGEATITRWRALLIGVRDYQDPSFTPVRYAVEDVTALADVLREVGYKSVRVLHSDQPSDEQPTIQNITGALDELARGADQRTLLLVYFAGHGVLDREEAYLLPCGRIGGRYDRFALNVRELESQLRESEARAVVLIMDACHAGARLGTRAADPEFVRRVIEQARGLAVLSGSDQRGVAHECDHCGHGIFTRYLLEALQGAACHDGDPYITASRTYEYVANQVAGWAERNHKRQHPTWEPGVYGDPPLVRRPERPCVNPFIVGPVIRDPLHFYGRGSELQAIIGRVGEISAQSISIVGERRIGKSSLLWQVKNQAETLFHTGHRYVVIYLDLSSAVGSSNRLLMRTLRRELTRAGLPAWKECDDGDLVALNYALEELEVAPPDTRLVLCLDEFEYISDHPAEFDGLLGELRADAQLGRLALVTASCVPLADLCARRRIQPSPFFNIFTHVALGPLDDTSWQALVQDGLSQVGDADWHFVAECAGRHPFLTQMAAALLWEARQAGTVDYVALRSKFEAQAEAHRSYWGQRRS
jgi:hypothetical protein